MEFRRSVRFIAGMILIAVGAFLLVSLVTHAPHEGPFPDFSAQPLRGNACGAAGAYISAYALALMGYASYLVAAGIALSGLLAAFKAGPSGLLRKLTGGMLITVGVLLGLAILNASPTGTVSSYRAAPGVAGGAFGVLLAGWLYRAVGSTGTFILFLFLCCVGAFLLADALLAALCREFAALAKAWGGRAVRVLRRRPRAEMAVPDAEAAGSAIGEGAPTTALPEAEPALMDDEEETVDIRLTSVEAQDEVVPREPVPSELEVVTRHTQRARPADEGETDFEFIEGVDGEGPGEYRLPPLGLLDEFASPPVADDEEEIKEKSRILERTLGEFNVGAKVVVVRRGPIITMYELSLAPGTRVSAVQSRADDLAIALKAPNVRIVAPLPGKNTIGMEVPNIERELVGLRELIEETHKSVGGMDIPMFLGKDTEGNPVVLDLAGCPHVLVAGATGSGKSVAIRGMICSMLMTRTPDQLQLLLIDPKGVEFNQYAQLPHLICPVLTDMKKAAAVLKWACKKMDERFSVLSSIGARDLKSYNALGQEAIVARLDVEDDAVVDDIPFFMPHIVIIVDELGELMMVAAKEVESSVIRLSQKARAVGIHLIFATQRPSMDVLTGLIKSNLPARIAFQVAAKVDSRIILDRNGAELLLGRGDLLLLPPGTSRLVRAQGAFVSEDETDRVVGFLESQGVPQFRADLREYHAQQGRTEESDDLYEDAVRIIVETQRGSVSLLQRRLSVGYSRAARLIDMMAEVGIVGPYRGSQARRVLMTLEEWERAHAEA